MSGSTGGTTSAGFTQSPNAFGGLNNTDLRPTKRRRRPVPLLDTTWPVTAASARRKERHMRKDVTALVDTLKKSVSEIAASAADNKDELLTKSVGEFQAALLSQLEPLMPEEDEPLGKGLNHIATFANALRDMDNRIKAILTGRPSYMVSNDGTPDDEPVPPEVAAQLDRFMQVGITTLRSMVNDTAELAVDEEDLERAEQAGELVKLDTITGEMMLKTTLPDQYLDHLVDPAELMLDCAALARSFQADALAMADGLAKADYLTEDVAELLADLLPETFENLAITADGIVPLAKADETGDDEDVGDESGDPNSAEDPGDMAGADDNSDLPQDPISMITRLASIIVVIGGSILQAQGGEQQGAQAADDGNVNNIPDDSNVGLQRAAPGHDIGDVPLEKILKGEIEVSPSLADALEKGLVAQNETAEMKKQLGEALQALDQLKSKYDQLAAQPAPAKGFTNSVGAVSKRDDSAMNTDLVTTAADQIEHMRKINPDRAASELIKLAHQGGGTPVIR